MTRSRVATSASLTIGVAFATLVVVGGILAGPAVIDCSQRGGSVGACLRGKLDQSGFTPRVAPQPPLTQEPAHNPGWIEANATEYDPPLPAVAELRGPPGRIGATGGTSAQAPIAADVAVAPGGRLLGGGAAVGATGASTDIALADTAGVLGAGGSTVLPKSRADVVALAAPSGSLLVTGAQGSSVTAGAPADASSVPLPDIGGAVGSTTMAAGVTLEAALEPVTTTPELVAVEPAIPLTTPPADPVAVTPPVKVAPPVSPAIVAAPSRPKPKFNPRYPNVLVLPPPNTGSNSSFATLQVR